MKVEFEDALFGNGEPYRGEPAITYRHYIVSPDPADKIDLDRLRELTVAWTQKHFGDYQVAIVYHDDNEHRIPHAHIVANNTNVETGRRLHVPQPKELNRDLQQMARERGLGYLADEHHLYDKKAKGGYSWVADIRERARTARALSTDEASYRELLGVLGVELSLNSPNARRRDYLYALADHPSRKVGGEKLGWPYGKGALEHEWLMLSPFREEKLREIAEHAILIKDLDELREMARAMETIKECHFTSIADIDWTIGRLEKQGRVADSQSVDDAPEKLEKIRHARRFAADYSILPAKEPKPVWNLWGHSSPSPTRWGDSSGSRSSSRSQERSVDRSRDDYAR